MKTKYIRSIKIALAHLVNGDPVEAVATLEMLAAQPDEFSRHEFRTIRNAKDEADIGNPQTAETLLSLLIT